MEPNYSFEVDDKQIFESVHYFPEDYYLSDIYSPIHKKVKEPQPPTPPSISKEMGISQEVDDARTIKNKNTDVDHKNIVGDLFVIHFMKLKSGIFENYICEIIA